MLNIDFGVLFLHNEPLASADTISSMYFPLSDCESYFTSSPEEIAARQGIFYDFLTDDIFFEAFSGACGHLNDLADLLRNLGNGQSDSAEELLYSLVELLAFINTVDAIDTAYSSAKKLTSERLIEFFDKIRCLKQDAEFCSLKNWLKDLDVNMRSIRSMTLGVNLDAQLNISEVGIVSINSHPFVCGNFFDKVMREEQPADDYQCLTVVGIRETKNLLQSSRMVINTEFYNSMNLLYRSALKSLRKQINSSVQETIRSLTAMRGDMNFLLRAVKMLRRQEEFGFTLNFPEIDTETSVEKLYNVLLAEKCRIEQIVPSAWNFSDAEKIYILTGPNSGGKSVYITSVGTAQLSFQLGLPICASGKVKMKPYERIVTHFIEATKRESESRLANESQRLQETLREIDKNTLLLLDETFSSTSAYDALFLSEALMRYLAKIGCDVIYVTHLHELPSRLEDIPVLHHIAPEVKDGRRTYRISAYRGEKETASLAKDIVIENGLGFLFEDYAERKENA